MPQPSADRTHPPAAGASLPAANAPPASAQGDAAAAGQTSFVGHARTVSVLTLLSRLTGLLREAALAKVFGRGPVADAFVFAFQIPNLFRRLFGEGALSAAFLPVYTQLLHEDRVLARRLASLCMGLLLVVLGGLTLLGEVILLGVLHGHGWADDTSLALRLTMVMLPYMPMVCLVALLGAICQVHGRFAAPSGAPIVLNVVMVAAMLLWGQGETEQAVVHSAYIVAGSVLVGGLLQMLWQGAAVLQVESVTRVLAGTRPAFRSLLAIFLPMAMGLAVFQINTFMDNVLAMALSPKDGRTTLQILNWQVDCPLPQGAVASLGWAQRLYEFPLGVFGIAIATAIFPALAHAAARLLAAKGTQDQRGAEQSSAVAAAGGAAAALAPAADDGNAFREILQHGLRLTVFIGLPASVGLILVRLPLVRLVFERGNFSLSDSLVVAAILAAYAPAIWAYSMNHVVTRAFHALKDARTPLRISMAMVALNFALNCTLVWWLGAAGLALATALTAVLQNVLLLRKIGGQVPRPVDAAVVRGWARTCLLTLVMALAVWPIAHYWDAALLSRRDSALALAAMTVTGALVYLAAAWLTRAPELRWLIRRR